MSVTELLDGVTVKSSATEGIALRLLEPGTTIVVNTRRSQYRLVILLEPDLVMVSGGNTFHEPRVVRFDGATDGGCALIVGRILVGFQMEMSLGPLRITSSRVRSVSIDRPPRLAGLS